MIFEHQPRMFKSIGKLPDCKRIKKVEIAPLDDLAKAWQVPVLLGMPLLQAYIYSDMNNERANITYG